MFVGPGSLHLASPWFIPDCYWLGPGSAGPARVSMTLYLSPLSTPRSPQIRSWFPLSMVLALLSRVWSWFPGSGPGSPESGPGSLGLVLPPWVWSWPPGSGPGSLGLVLAPWVWSWLPGSGPASFIDGSGPAPLGLVLAPWVWSCFLHRWVWSCSLWVWSCLLWVWSCSLWV